MRSILVGSLVSILVSSAITVEAAPLPRIQGIKTEIAMTVNRKRPSQSSIRAEDVLIRKVRGSVSTREDVFEFKVPAHGIDGTVKVRSSQKRPSGLTVSLDRFAETVHNVANATLGPTVNAMGTVFENGVAAPLSTVGSAVELVVNEGIVRPITTVLRDGVAKPLAVTLEGAAAVPRALAPGLKAVGAGALTALTLGFWRPRR